MLNSMKAHIICGLILGQSYALAVNIYAAAADGKLTRYSLHKVGQSYDLQARYSTDECGSAPIWLDKDKDANLLYCVDRGGSVSTFKPTRDGQLTRIDRKNTTVGPVSNAFYNTGKRRGMALAHYAGSAVTTWDAPPNGTLTLLDTKIYTTPTGPRQPNQNAPHPHQALTDPSGRFIIVPDLGADLLRVYTFDADTNLLKEEEPIVTNPGTGPRHGVFWSPSGSPHKKGPLYFELVSELSSNVTSYKVIYPAAGGIQFERLAEVSNFGNYSEGANYYAAAAEIAVSPDNKFLITSNRNDTTFQIPSLNGTTSSEPSDSLAVFKINQNGTVSFLQLAPAGGQHPRQFSINKAGNLVAVGLLNTQRLAIIERNVTTGLLGKVVAFADQAGQVAFALWDE